MKTLTSKPFLLAALCIGICNVSLADEGIEFFEKKIRPMLAKHCYECHSAKAKKAKAGLLLDRKAGWEMGGENGAAIIPGKPEESRLMIAIRYDNNDIRMPKAGKLPSQVIKDFEKWIEMGAPDPRDQPLDAKFVHTGPRSKPLEEARKFWSFQPLAKPTPPKTQDADWAKDRLDHFVLVKLEEKNLKPAKPADWGTLFRRVHFDLIGLPPEPEQIDAFLSKPSQEALAKTIDELLDSPQYAERWGRHWLDVARYADTTGGGRNLQFPNAYRYRDWVLASYRQDKPIDQFIRQQIAGDLLPSDSDEEFNDNLIGTTFLALGPHNYELQDKALLRMEIVDEQLAAVSRAFLGMTIGCARCHDHPFDPLPTAEYYSLAGIFRSTNSSRPGNVANFIERGLKDQHGDSRKKHAEAAKVLNDKLKQLENELKVLGGKVPADSKSSQKSLDPKKIKGIVIDDTQAKLVGTWVSSTHTASFVGKSYRHDNGQNKGEKSATWKATIPQSGIYEVQISYSASSNRSPKDPLTIFTDLEEKTVHINQQAKPPIDGTFFSLGKFNFEEGEWDVVKINTMGTTGIVIIDSVRLLAEDAPKTSLPPIAEKKPKKKDPEKKAKEAKKKELQTVIAALKKDIDAHKKAAPPKSPVTMSVEEHQEAGDWHIHVRGGIRNLGKKVKRGFITAATPVGQSPKPEIPEGASGRLELAKWVASSDNTLTARVYVNRVWHHLFGRGIVASNDNFGEMGRRPTHPELLDHLASEFIDQGWSTKTLIRRILLSSTYQMSSEASTNSLEQDPDNELFSRQNRRRLQVEAIHDAMLVASGKLNPASEKTKERALYDKLDRNKIPEMLDIFDFPNPNLVSGVRNASTVPTQALFLMNDPFVIKEAETAAKRLLERKGLNVEERLNFAYKITLGREPREEEKSLALNYLAQHNQGKDHPEAWAGILHSLYACVDFRYLN